MSMRLKPHMFVGGLLLALAACSGPGDGVTSDAVEDPARTSADEVATATASASAQEDNDLFDLLPSSIQESGELVVAGSAALPPTQFLDPDDGTVVGYFPEILELIAQELGVELRFEVTSFDGILTGVEAGRYDVGISFQDTPERQEVANMIGLFNQTDLWVVTPDYTDTETPPCGKRVGVGSGSVEHVIAERISEEECVAKGKPPMIVQVFPNNPEANTALTAGRVDATLTNAATAGYMIEQSGGDFAVLGEPVDLDAVVGLAVAKDNDELTQAIVEAAQNVLDSPKYEEVLKKWNVESLARETVTLNIDHDE